jgi:hypothetical protein
LILLESEILFLFAEIEKQYNKYKPTKDHNLLFNNKCNDNNKKDDQNTYYEDETK